MFLSSARTDYEFNYYVLAGLILSVLIHLAAILLLNPLAVPASPGPLVVDVFFEPPPPAIPPEPAAENSAPRNQLVSPPDTSSEPQPGRQTALLSDRDSYAKREQVRRGHGLTPGIPGQPQREAPERMAAGKSPITAREQPPASALRELKLDQQTMLSEFGQAQSATPAAPRTLDELVAGKDSRSISRESYRAFSRPSGSGAAFLGLGGTSDYLPNLPDGDITMLNTKATLFAVFVRRVATQVFSQLRSQGWESLSPASIRAISGFARVRASLGPDGRLLEVELLGSSGSPRFDEVLQAAAKAGSRDPNPPPQAAAEDGNFHFIFEARSWVQAGVAPTGFPAERRWLLLSTGLE